MRSTITRALSLWLTIITLMAVLTACAGAPQAPTAAALTTGTEEEHQSPSGATARGRAQSPKPTEE